MLILFKLKTQMETDQIRFLHHILVPLNLLAILAPFQSVKLGTPSYRFRMPAVDLTSFKRNPNYVRMYLSISISCLLNKPKTKIIYKF